MTQKIPDIREGDSILVHRHGDAVPEHMRVKPLRKGFIFAVSCFPVLFHHVVDRARLHLGVQGIMHREKQIRIFGTALMELNEVFMVSIAFLYSVWAKDSARTSRALLRPPYNTPARSLPQFLGTVLPVLSGYFAVQAYAARR